MWILLILRTFIFQDAMDLVEFLVIRGGGGGGGVVAVSFFNIYSGYC